MTDIILHDGPTLPPLIPHDASANQRKQLQRFEAWLDGRNLHYTGIDDLAPYVAHLKRRGLSPASIAAYVSAARTRLRDLANNNALLMTLLDAAPGTPADRKAYADVVLKRLENTAKSVKIKGRRVEAYTDQQQVRIKPKQAVELLDLPFKKHVDKDTGNATPRAYRDAAIIALSLGTGLRSIEIARLTLSRQINKSRVMSDLDHTLEGHRALFVAEGKGAVTRVVPFGERQWWLNEIGFWPLDYVQYWLDVAGITTGPIFQGFTSRWLNGHKHKQLDTSSIRRILQAIMPLPDGTIVSPHDLRRTYAKWMYDLAGKPIEVVQKLLGHRDIKTTQRYIGTLETELLVPGYGYED